MLITRDMVDFIRILKNHRVKHVLVGGFAVIYYGYVRTTQDIDILIYPSKANAKKLLKALDEFGFGDIEFTQELFEREGTAIHLGAEPNRINVLTVLKGVANKDVFARMKRIQYKKISLNVISYRDLIDCKRQSTRLKDLADVDMLEKSRAKRKNHECQPDKP